MKASAKTFALLLILAFGCFAGGLAFERVKFFPYARIRSAWVRLHHASAPRKVDVSAAIAKSLSVESGELKFTKEIDSTLLPLHLTGFKLSAKFPVAKFAGGLAAIGNKAIIVDRLGGVFAFDHGDFTKLTFPALPTNIEGFVQRGTLTNENFRVHDVAYLSAARTLAVSHELYDGASHQTRLAVSTIAFDPILLQPSGDWRTIWQGDVAPPGHPPASPGGGRMAADASNHLYLTTIDYLPDDFTHPAPELAQDPKSTFGKIFQIDLGTGQSKMVSLGHRNPQGLLLTGAGELLSVEHGPAGGDKLNRIIEGTNYGWPKVTLGTEYQSYGWPGSAPVGRHDGYPAPIFAWVPSVAACNLIEIKGFHPRWDGDLLVASLKACSLYRLRREGERVLYSEPIWIGERIRDLAQLADGSIVLWTDNANLLLLNVDEPKLSANRKTPDFTTPLVMTACMACHHFGPTHPSHLAPTLSHLLGRTVATDHFERYSPALKSLGGVWDATRLKAFVSDPAKFAPGATMPKQDLTESDLTAIVQVLQAQSGK